MRFKTTGWFQIQRYKNEIQDHRLVLNTEVQERDSRPQVGSKYRGTGMRFKTTGWLQIQRYRNEIQDHRLVPNIEVQE